MAYVLTVRDRCTPTACRAFRSVTEPRQIAANMEDRVYENLIMRYASSWNTPQAAAGMIAALPPSMPDGQADQRRIPDLGLHPAGQHHVAGAAARRRAEAAVSCRAFGRASPPRPAAAPAPPQAQAAAKKPPPAPKRPSSAAPVQLTPSGAAPTADNSE